MASTSISISGAGSGFDWQSIVTKLMAIEQIPLTQLQDQSTEQDLRRGVYSDLLTGLTAVDTAASALRSLDGAALDAVAGSSSDTGVATATAADGAAAASASVEVLSLPTAAQAFATAPIYAGIPAQPAAATSASDIRSGSFDPNASLASQAGALGVAPGASGSFSINGATVNWTSADSLNSILGKVNALGTGVSASFDGASGKVSLGTIATGGAATLTLDETAGNLFSTLGISSGVSNGAAAKSFDPRVPMGDANSNIIPPLMDGVFTINGVKFSLPASTTSLNQAIAAINASSAGVKMTYDPNSGRVGIQSTSTGAGSQLVLGAAGDTSNFLQALHLGPVVAGADGSVKVNGGAAQAVSSLKSTGLVPGATINLKGTGTTLVTVGANADSAVTAVQSLVDAYNSAVDSIFSKMTEDPVKNAATAADRLKGAFNGDDVFSGALDALVNTAAGTRLASGTTRVLEQIGISLESNGPGKPQVLAFDEAKFRAALDSDPDAVKALIGGTGTGLADKLHRALQTFVLPASGSIKLTNDEITANQAMLNQQILDMQDRLDQTKTTLTNQYIAMETMLTDLQSQSTQLTNMTNAMNKSTN